MPALDAAAAPSALAAVAAADPAPAAAAAAAQTAAAAAAAPNAYDSLLAPPNSFPFNIPSAALVGVIVAFVIVLGAVLVRTGLAVRAARRLGLAAAAAADAPAPAPHSAFARPSPAGAMADARRSIGRPASANGAASLARDTAPSRLGSKGPRSSPWQLKRASVSDPEIAEIDRPAMPARSASTLAKATSQSQSLALPQIPIIDAAIAGVPPPKLARSNSARSVARSNSARSSRAPAARQPSPETSLPVLPSLSFEQSISIPSLQELEADPHRQRINEVIANALRRTHESFAHLSDNPEDSAFTLPTLS